MGLLSFDRSGSSRYLNKNPKHVSLCLFFFFKYVSANCVYAEEFKVPLCKTVLPLTLWMDFHLEKNACPVEIILRHSLPSTRRTKQRLRNLFHSSSTNYWEHKNSLVLLTILFSFNKNVRFTLFFFLWEEETSIAETLVSLLLMVFFFPSNVFLLITHQNLHRHRKLSTISEHR